MSPKFVSRTLALAGLTALLLAIPLSAIAAPIATADVLTVNAPMLSLPDPVAVVVTADNGPIFLTVPVPEGLTPANVTGSITPVVLGAGSLHVIVAGQVVQNLDPSVPSILDVPLAGAEIVNGTVSVSLEYSSLLANNNWCQVTNPASVTVSNVVLQATGSATMPTTLADFFSPAVNAVSVQISDNPSSALKQAAISAVGALAFGLGSTVNLSATTTSNTSHRVALDSVRGRIVVLDPSGDAVTTTISSDGSGIPVLTIAGPEAQLSAASAALGSGYLALANSASTTGLAQTGSVTSVLSPTLFDLGASDRISLGGYGQSASYTGVSQSAFGGPISDATLHLVGTHTDIPDTILATTNVYWNDFLIGSTVLGHDVAFGLDLPIASTRMTAGNGLRIVLSAVPRTGECTGSTNVIPIELFIDAKASTIDATRGQSIKPGFQRFPQALGGVLPVAFGNGMTPANALASAGDIVASLQRQSRVQLNVTVVAAADFLQSAHSGLFVGATSDDSNVLGAPLRFDSFRAIDSRAVEFGVGTTVPYAALEAFENSGRNVLMLGGWSPDGTGAALQDLQIDAAHYAVNGDAGWTGLSGDLLIAQPTLAKPVFLDSNAIVPQASVTDDFRGYAMWIGILIALLVSVGVIGSIVRRRRRAKVKHYVDAQALGVAEQARAEQINIAKATHQNSTLE
ncbi:hypothetical protein GCM10027022_00690 [Alpinimonas psychrophila]|uniref:Cellulose synthase regulatory subunit n=1 Tax=Alpinimonas psychrophila TaxID=748908 RepID=A0A7W3PQ26_9MICO|nr:hypothetical protein [Alpinimonas psychrophila]MBA8829936.1 hypothetical protein [Alpinimonas psychrophila]